jgi:hypothetical protein
LSNDQDPSGPLSAASVALYPNPTIGSMLLEDNYPESQRIISMELWDLQGRKLETVALDLGKRTHDLNFQPYFPSMYLLRLHHKSGRQSVMRVVKQ